MTVNSYLGTLASDLVVRDTEREKINRSVGAIKFRLENYFGDEISDILLFGSYTRGTILPRSVDPNSDIDIMVVFPNVYGYKPQTFLDKLKRFAEYWYPNSTVAQSRPSIVLKLEHIKFEITPAHTCFANSYYIPKDRSSWQTTNPNGFNDSLIKCNEKNGYKIKPVIRLMKLWNFKLNDGDLPSFELEKKISENLEYAYLNCTSYCDYLKEAFSAIKWHANWNKVDDAVRRINKALEDEANGLPYSAELEIAKVFPE